MLLAISRSGNGLMLRKQYFAKSVKESCQTFSYFWKSNAFPVHITLYITWIHRSSVLIYQKNLVKLFPYLWELNCLYPPARLLFAFLCTFLRSAVQLFGFLPQPSPWKVSSQYRNGSNGFPWIEYGDSRYFADTWRAEAAPRLYLRSVKLSIMAS